MNTKKKKHHEFTLWIYDWERSEEKVPAVLFEEGTSFDEILLTMLAVDQLGLCSSLTCDTWTEHVKDESEDLKFD